MEKRECSSTGCYCGTPESCEGLNSHKKLVWCDYTKCMWNVPVSPGVHIKHHKDWKPIGDGNVDRFPGVCGRVEIGLRYAEIHSIHGKTKAISCKFWSDTKIGGHTDFSRLLQSDGTPYGGTIPEPATPDAAFHV